MAADNFSLDVLVRSIKELRNPELARQLRDALKSSNVNPDMIAEFVEELENDLEEHITRLERLRDALTPEERDHPEAMEPIRRQEVAYKTQCDQEEVDSLCDAFARAREMLANMGENARLQFDVKLLFSNLGGMIGLDVGAHAEGDKTDDKTSKDAGQALPQFFQKLIQSGIKSHKRREENAQKPKSGFDEMMNGPDFDAMFDTSRTVAPKNRLPKKPL